MVSGWQIVRWRPLLPVETDRRPGRGRMTAYRLPDAAKVAAELAIAIDGGCDLEEAAVAAFLEGAPVEEKELRRILLRQVWRMEGTLLAAREYVSVPRSKVPRSRRVPLRHSRRPESKQITRDLLDLLLGSRPSSFGLYRVVESLLPEQSWHALKQADPRFSRRLGRLFDAWSLAAIRRTIKNASLQDLRWSCDTAATLLAWAELVEQTNKLSGVDQPSQDLLAKMLQPVAAQLKRSAKGKSSAKNVPWLAVGFLMAVGSDRQALQDAADNCRMALPALRCSLRLSAYLPEEWRPALAWSGGAEFIDGLPSHEQQRLVETVAGWLQEHTDEHPGVALVGRWASGRVDDC